MNYINKEKKNGFSPNCNSSGRNRGEEITSYMQEKKEEVEKRLDKILPDSDRLLVHAMRYSLLSGGKRLRPVLCLASAESVGSVTEPVWASAIALEMIHTYSLIHDDLPCMDNDSLRRGKPTLHMAFDEATAVLAGDALLTMAFGVLADAGNTCPESGGHILQVISRIAHASGHPGMIEGQMRDMKAEGIQLGLFELQKVHEHKTGALIRAAVFSGGLLGGGNPFEIHALEEYAKAVGLAFQVADDLLNVEGDPKILGKAVGTDVAKKKNTYPGLVGLEKTKETARELVEESISALSGFGQKAWPLRRLARYIIERDF